ncbi:MAG: PorT family protein, partial [Hymenobacteraceae bacterium]|nr:PorT family protein [Hymenobacteraceae bacterium]MDX5396809.1 PorT family protein [Hymenobacteraceae bacterium]MDX5512877.1 PorT family protein [Hymenobacteraceae bacterium]
MKTFCYSLMLVIPSFFAVASSAFAQSQFSYGANVYANFARPAFYVPWSARVFCEGAEGAVQRFSYSGGISLFYKVSDKIHLQSGLNYVNTGVLHKTTFAYDDYNLEELSKNHTTHMLDVPLNVKYKFRKGKESGLYALAGSGIWLNV